MKRLLTFVVLSVAALAVPLAGTAVADAAGTPNAKACLGVFVAANGLQGRSLQDIANTLEEVAPATAAFYDAEYGNGDGNLTAGEVALVSKRGDGPCGDNT